MIKELFETEAYRTFKKEVCKENLIETCMYDNDGTPFGQYGTLHSTTLFTHLALMRCMFVSLSEQKQMFKSNVKNGKLNKPVFLDIGSGAGNLVIYAAHQGWQSYGIEISESCARLSLVNVKKAEDAGYIPKGSIKIEFANIFPVDFKIEKFPGDANEDDFRETLDKYAKKAPKGIKCVKLDQVDLFYHYQVERRQNILNLFSKYAKEGSMLVFVETRKDSYKIPEDVKELDNYQGMAVYIKNN